MKKNLLFTLLLAAGTAWSQTLTHHYDPYQQTVEAGGLLSCHDNGSPFESSYYTTFNLANEGYGIEGDQYEISEIEFGIEYISGVASYPMTVRLYTTDQDFPAGFDTLEGYTLQAESVFQVPAQQLGIYSAAINATVPTDTYLLVEISYGEDPDGLAMVSLGGNANGSWGTTWTTSPACGVNTPTSMATIAFQNGLEGSYALVLNVIGEGNLGLDNHEQNIFHIYPNPTSGIIHIGTDTAFDQLKLTDVTGKVLTLPAVENNELDLSALPTGIYYIILESGASSQKRKIIKY